MKKERLKKPIWIILAGSGLIGLLILTGVISIGEEEIEKVHRNSYQGMEREESFLLKTEDGKELPVQIQVKEQIYTQEQMQEFFQEAEKRIPEEILGENENLEEVWSDLELMEQLSDNPIMIAWETSNGEYLSPYGERTEKELEEDTLDMEISAELSLQDMEKRLTFPIRLVKRKGNAEEIFLDLVKAEVEKQQEESRTQPDFQLPKSVDGITLTWIKKNTVSIGGMFFLVVLAAGLMYWKEEKEIEKQRKLRKEQMLLDYPDVVSKLTLLLGAGISLQRAWGKMVREYLQKREKKQSNKRFAYEEMVFTYREMENGVSVQAALSHFGTRCDVPVYLKFSTLLAQNVKRGNRGLVENLQRESEEAFEERKAMAKMLGEQASTKLLLPMFLMLFMVLVVIMIPAFLSFSF